MYGALCRALAQLSVELFVIRALCWLRKRGRVFRARKAAWQVILLCAAIWSANLSLGVLLRQSNRTRSMRGFHNDCRFCSARWIYPLFLHEMAFSIVRHKGGARCPS